MTPVQSRIAVPLVAALAAGLIIASSGVFGSDDPSRSELTGRSSPAQITGHVHGIARHPDSGHIYVATHDGLYVIAGSAPLTRVGPVIDLMGFTITGQGELLASGHPGAGTDLPQPVGLIESTDGGKSWTVRSRGGQSDFHTLTQSSEGVTGYDGTLRSSVDGRTWSTLPHLEGVTSLGASPEGAGVLAATDAGLHVSSASGSTWDPVPNAPPLVLLDWADATRVVGVDRAGTVYVSTDAGRTWLPSSAEPLSPTQAVGASIVEGRLEVLAVTHDDLVISSDGGTTFTTLA